MSELKVEVKAFKPSIIEQPVRWQSQLVDSLDSDGKFSIFKTCKQLRDIVLHAARRTKIKQGHSTPTRHGVSALMTAQRQNSNVVIDVSDFQVVTDRSKRLRFVAQTLLVNSASLLGTMLTCIKEVHLTDVSLDYLAPPNLIAVCPSARCLKLNGCILEDLPPVDMQLPSSPQIKSLHIVGCVHTSKECTIQQLQQQLGMLVGLTELTIESTRVDQRFLNACSVLDGHLTSYTYQWPVNKSQSLTEPLPLLPPITSLVRVVHSAVLNDDALRAMLDMPALRDVAAPGVSLRNSYSMRPCAWTRVQLDRITMAQLDQLPRGLSRSMVLHHISLQDHRSFSQQLAAAHLLVAGYDIDARERGYKQGCQVTAASDSGIVLELPSLFTRTTCFSAAQVTQLLMAYLPMFSTYTGPLAIETNDLFTFSAEVIASVNKHLTGITGRLDLRGAVFDHGVLTSVLPKLPCGVAKLHLDQCMVQYPNARARLGEADLVALCAGAQSPVIVSFTVSGQCAPGWRERVRDRVEAMHEGRCCVVSLEETPSSQAVPILR